MAQTVSISPKPFRFFDLPQELQNSIVEKLNPLTLDDAKSLINFSRTSNRGQELIRSVLYEHSTNLMKISSLSYSLQMRGKYYNRLYPFENNSHMEFSSHKTGTARYVNSDGRIIHTFPQNGYCSAIELLPDGQFLAGSESKHHALRIINPRSGISASIKQETEVSALALLNNSKAVTVSLLSRYICVYDLKLQKRINKFPKEAISSVAALKDDYFIVTDGLYPTDINLYHAEKGHIQTLYSYPNIIEMLPLQDSNILVASQQIQSAIDQPKPPLELHIINMQGELLAIHSRENTYDKKVMIEIWPNNKIAITNFKRANLNDQGFQKRIESETAPNNRMVTTISKFKIDQVDEFMREIDLIDLKEFNYTFSEK